jgi:hypothetical protein
MAKIIATYSPCCGIFHVGDAEQGIMHCALPHERKVVRLVDVRELEGEAKKWADLMEYCEQQRVDFLKRFGDPTESR